MTVVFTMSQISSYQNERCIKIKHNAQGVHNKANAQVKFSPMWLAFGKLFFKLSSLVYVRKFIPLIENEIWHMSYNICSTKQGFGILIRYV